MSSALGTLALLVFLILAIPVVLENLGAVLLAVGLVSVGLGVLSLMGLAYEHARGDLR